MHLKIATAELLSSMKRCKGIVNSNTTMPILAHVLLSAMGERLTLTAFDLEIAVIAERPAEVLRPGTITLPARTLFELTKSLPTDGSVELELVARNAVKLTAGTASFKLPGLSASEYPPLPKADADESTLHLDAKAFVTLIGKVAFAACGEPMAGRESLCGALLESDGPRLVLVATDGSRMNLASTAGSEQFKVPENTIIPTKALNELRKALEEDATSEVVLSVGRAFVMVRIPGLTMLARLISGDFPNYRQVLGRLPQGPVEVNRQTLLDSVKRVGLVSDALRSAAILRMEGSSIHVEAAGAATGEGSESMPVTFDGNARKVALNHRLLAEALAAIDGEVVRFDVGTETEPVAFRPTAAGDQQVAIVMPIV